MPDQLPQTSPRVAPVQPLYGPAENPAAVPQQTPEYRQAEYQAPTNYGTPQPPPQVVHVVAAPPAPEQPIPEELQPSVTLVSHSALFYWWPVWAVGYGCAIATYLQGQAIQVGNHVVNIHTSNNLGVFFFLTLFLVIMISNVIVRGLASVIVILSIITVTITLAYFNLWDSILGWMGELTIYLNQGAYFWFSTLIFLVWALTVFVFDRMSYWRVRPGQMTHMVVLGAASRSYDTENMSFEKRRDDVFRHWLLGLGSGDLIVNAFNGGHPEEVHIPNVLFIGLKIRAVQQLIAMKATESSGPASR